MYKAVGYLRRSTDDKQADSIDIQREEILDYAARHGYEIVRWYIDDGVSGHNVDRDDFVRMIEDAETKNDFDFVLVRHQSRFARFRPAKTIRYLDRLDDVGVRLVTSKQGAIDINDLAQFLIASIEAQTDHSFSKTLSELTIRGQSKQANSGYSAGQAAPYGYDRMLVDEEGNHRTRVKRGEKVAKPDGWHTTFVPGDPAHVAHVQWIFAQYLSGDSPWTIAKTLNKRGVPSPRGGKWNKGTIRDMLKNEIYCGDFAWNKTRQGRFHSLVDGKATERSRSENAPTKSGRRKHKVLLNDREDWVVVQQCHEAIIDKSDWLAIQVRMRKNTTHPGGAHAKQGYEYLVRGLVHCECGAKMHGRITKRRKNGKVYEKRKYVCAAYDSNGTCKHNWAGADELHEKVIDQFLRILRDPKNLARLTAMINHRLATPRSEDTQVQSLTRQLAELDQKMQAGADRVLSAPDDVLETVYDQIRKSKSERRHVEDELRTVLAKSKKADSASWSVNDVLAAVKKLADQLGSGEPKAVQAALKANIERIQLRFRTEQDGKRSIQRLAGGEIHLVTERQVAGAGFEPTTSRL